MHSAVTAAATPTLFSTTATNCRVVKAWRRFSPVSVVVGSLEIGSIVKNAAATSRDSDPM